MDIHIHTKESSYCARVAARDVVHLYKEKGYRQASGSAGTAAVGDEVRPGR